MALACRRVRGLGRNRSLLGLADNGLRVLKRRGKCRDVGPAAGRGRKSHRDIAKLALDPPQALGLFPRVAFKLAPARGEIGKRAGQFAKILFRFRNHLICGGGALIDTAAALGIRLALLRERLFLRRQTGKCFLGIRRERALARDILAQLRQPAIELGDALLGAGFLAVERFAGDDETLQAGGGLGKGLAQRGQRFGHALAALAGLRLRQRGCRDRANAQILGALGLLDFGIGVAPAQVEQHGLGLAHFRRDIPVLNGLPRLPLERVNLRSQLFDHILDAQQVRLGRLQPQLRLMPPRMQTGNARSFLQHAPALFGLGLNDLADPALMHQRGRTRAGRGIGEQRHHVACAHFAAVDAVERTLFALDPPRNIDGLVLVELTRRLMLAVVDPDRDLGRIAAWPVVGARKDHVVHLGRAHGLVRGLAHHPAQRLDQVRLAAAVRPDHAGEPWLDQKIGRFDERLESQKT